MLGISALTVPNIASAAVDGDYNEANQIYLGGDYRTVLPAAPKTGNVSRIYLLDNGELWAQYSNGDAHQLGDIWKVIEGKQGEQGLQGEPGDDGASVGVIVTPVEAAEGVQPGTQVEFFKDFNGDGIKNGEDSDLNSFFIPNGVDGVDGQDGRGIENIEINEAGELVITYTDGGSVNLGNVKGADGQDGQDGVDGQDGRGIENIEINEAGELVITYTDGGSVNLGNVKGADGKDGADGEDGADGKDGVDGKDGLTPTIGGNGNWWIGGVDTGVKAVGTDGKDGKDATLSSGSSQTCIAAGLQVGLPLLFLLPLGLASQLNIPGLTGMSDQIGAAIEQANTALQQQAGIFDPNSAKPVQDLNNMLGKVGLNAGTALAGLALVAAGIAAASHIADACGPAAEQNNDEEASLSSIKAGSSENN